MDTVIIYTPDAEAASRALAEAWRGRSVVRVCATGGAPMSIGRHLLAIGVAGPTAANSEAERQLLETLKDQSLAAVLLVAPGRDAPGDLSAVRLPALRSSGDAARDVQNIDAALRELGRSVVFGGAPRAIFARVGRPRAPKAEDVGLGAHAHDQEPEWGAEPAPQANVPSGSAGKRWLGFVLGLSLGVVVALFLLAPWAYSLLTAATAR